MPHIPHEIPPVCRLEVTTKARDAESPRLLVGKPGAVCLSLWREYPVAQVVFLSNHNKSSCKPDSCS